MFDYLIVGAGFAGSVLAERLASQSEKDPSLTSETTLAEMPTITTMLQAFSSTSTVPTFSHQLPRGLRVPRTSPSGGPTSTVY